MLTGVDLSNHNGPPETYENEPWFRAAEFVIAQCIRPPRPYPGWEVGGYTMAQLRHARQKGKKVGTYPWLWHGQAEDELRADIRRRLDIIDPDFPLDMRPWPDVEDNRTTGLVAEPRPPEAHAWPESPPVTRIALAGPLGFTVTARQNDVLIARAVSDQWAAERGLPPSGGYSAKWFVDGYLGGWWPDGWLKWWAYYGITPGSLIGGLVVAHQYTSTPIDTDVMLESEIVSGGGDVPDPNVDYGWQQKKDLVVQTAGELLAVSDQLLAEANRRGGPRAKEIRRLANPEVRARAERILA